MLSADERRLAIGALAARLQAAATAAGAGAWAAGYGSVLERASWGGEGGGDAVAGISASGSGDWAESSGGFLVPVPIPVRPLDLRLKAELCG